MIGLVYFLLLGLYLLISAYAIYRSTLYARRKYNKGWLGGWLAALLMYNLVFWDWIPVYMMHKYYCSSEAGFWVYKSPEQWIKENPEKIGKKWGVNEIQKYETINEYTRRHWSSDRIYMEITQTRSFNDKIGRSEDVLIDKETGDVLARTVEFYRGSPGALALGANSLSDYKIWLGMGHRNCGPISAVQGFMNLSSENRYELEQLGRGEIK